MNLLEKLVQADIEKAYKLNESTYASKRLAEILGESEPVEVKIKEIPQRRLTEIKGMMYSKDGKFVYERSFDSNLMAIVEGVKDPDIRSEELREHFNAPDPKHLAEVLFGREVEDLADQIIKLSGADESAEEEVKN